MPRGYRNRKPGAHRYSKKRIRRRWPGFTAARPRGRHYEVLHQAWKGSRGDWYLYGFALNRDGAKKIIRDADRPGDYIFREVVGGRPLMRHWLTTKISVRRVYY